MEDTKELKLAEFIDWVLKYKLFGREFRSKYGTRVYITVDGHISILGDNAKDRLLALNDTFKVWDD